MQISFDLKNSTSCSCAGTKRASKGKSLLESLSGYTVIDLETTGLDPSCDDIIEVAGVRIRNGKVESEFQSLINPGFDIPPFITELTGITNKMLSTAPSLSEVLPDFLRFIGDDTIVGHNVNFDINFIYDKCIELLNRPFVNDFLDTMRLSRRLYQEEQHHRLKDVVERLGIGTEVEHRALGDAMQTFQAYEHMKSYANTNNIPFRSLYPRTYSYYTHAREIKATTVDFDSSSPLYGKLFVFTGVLEKMSRKEAMQCVVNMGGQCGDSVTHKTDYLVLGNNDYCTTIKDGKSSKQKRAEALKLAGNDIEIISENVFYDMLEYENDELSPATSMDGTDNDVTVPSAESRPFQIDDAYSYILSLADDPWFAKLEEKPSFYSVIWFRQLAARILKVPSAIEFKAAFISSPEAYGLPYQRMSTGNVRFSLSSLDDVTKLSSLFVSVHNSLKDSAPVDSFGCCSSFTECSDALACLHPKDYLYLGCMYRKNLESGRIFYGKNCNHIPKSHR